jgi:hypothetical protein
LDTPTQIGFVRHGVAGWGDALRAMLWALRAGAGFGFIGSFLFGAFSVMVLRSVLGRSTWGIGACLAAGILAGAMYVSVALIIHAVPRSYWAVRNIVSAFLGTWPLVESLDGGLTDILVGTTAPLIGGVIAAIAFWMMAGRRVAAT